MAEFFFEFFLNCLDLIVGPFKKPQSTKNLIGFGIVFIFLTALVVYWLTL